MVVLVEGALVVPLGLEVVGLGVLVGVGLGVLVGTGFAVVTTGFLVVVAGGGGVSVRGETNRKTTLYPKIRCSLSEGVTGVLNLGKHGLTKI